MSQSNWMNKPAILNLGFVSCLSFEIIHLGKCLGKEKFLQDLEVTIFFFPFRKLVFKIIDELLRVKFCAFFIRFPLKRLMRLIKY